MAMMDAMMVVNDVGGMTIHVLNFRARIAREGFIAETSRLCQISGSPEQGRKARP